jgi:hypothetical protein
MFASRASQEENGEELKTAQLCQGK